MVAALCINFDMTDFLNAAQALEIFTTTANAPNGQGKAETFADVDLGDDQCALPAVGRQDRQAVDLHVDWEKIKLVRELKENGVFQIKGARRPGGASFGDSRVTPSTTTSKKSRLSSAS
ncbi:MAG: hypothetical protein MZU91_13730 [Desulfosudis oleivorans]|nr:hypothetical protein [Desulfosudis oleivorans]